MRPIATGGRGGRGLRWLRVEGDGKPDPLPARPQVLTSLRVQVKQPGHEGRQVLVRGKVNRFADGEVLRQHVADDLADERPQLVADVTYSRPRRPSSAASAAWRTSASEPDKYSRPVAPIIR